jgi:hypothetical protein
VGALARGLALPSYTTTGGTTFEMVDEEEGTINLALSNGLLAAVASLLEMILNER